MLISDFEIEKVKITSKIYHVDLPFESSLNRLMGVYLYIRNNYYSHYTVS